MRIATKIWDSGWGAVFLTVYTGTVLHLLIPGQPLFKILALFPTILVMFLADRYSNWLVDFFAGGELRRSTEYVEAKTGEDHFYHAAREEVQTSVDDLDRRAYQNNISILTGIVIGVTAPFIGFYQRAIIGGLFGILLACCAIHWLTKSSITQLNTLARDIREPYKAKYENQ